MVVRKRSFIKKVLFWFLIAVVVIFVAYPFVYMVSVSFRYDSDAFDPGLIPDNPTITQYAQLLGLQESIRQQMSQEEQQLMKLLESLPGEQRELVFKNIQAQRKRESFPFLRWFGNSLLLAGASALTSVLIGIFGAYSFSRIWFPGRNLIQRGVLLVYLVGGVILSVPIYDIFVRLGLTNSSGASLFSLYIIYVIQTLPVSLYMLGNYFRTIPESIEEAALIDGSTRMGTIMKIIIPLSMPAIITVFIYAFMIGWNEYLFASIFIRPFPGAYTLSVGLREVFFSEHAVWAKMMAASVLTAVPVIVLFMFVEKYLTAGLTAGGVKE